MTSLEGTYYDKFCAEKARAERLSALLLDPPPDVQELVIKKLDLVHRSLVDAERARADCAERKADLYRHEKHAWDKTVRERDEARAACAEMREVLQNVEHGSEDAWYRWLAKRDHALSTSCGTGWLSPEKRKVAIEALQLAKDVTSHGFLPNPKTGSFTKTHFDVHQVIDDALAALKDEQ